MRCRPSLLAAIADHPLRRTAAGGIAAIGASPSNRAGGGPRAVTVPSLDWQKLPGYWWPLGSFLQWIRADHLRKERTCTTPAREARETPHSPPDAPSSPPRPASPTALAAAAALVRRRRPGRQATARPHLPHDASGEGRPALRDAGLRPLRHRPRPGRRRRQPQGDRGPHGRRAGREVPGRRHHLLRLGAQHPRAAPDRRPVQRHPAGLAGTAARAARARLHRPGARDRGAGGQSPRRSSRGPWPSVRAGRAPTPARSAGSRAPSCGRWASGRTTPPWPT